MIARAPRGEEDLTAAENGSHWGEGEVERAIGEARFPGFRMCDAERRFGCWWLVVGGQVIAYVVQPIFTSLMAESLVMATGPRPCGWCRYVAAVHVFVLFCHHPWTAMVFLEFWECGRELSRVTTALSSRV